jgi:hypothetical protein
VHGEPLGCTEDCYVPVPYDLIPPLTSARNLASEDKKLFAALLAVSWSRLESQRDPATLSPLRAPARRLRRVVGQPGERKNHRLRASLERLATVPVFPTGEGGAGPLVPLLSAYEITRTPDGDEATWRFDEAVNAVCAYPARWSFLNLRSCRDFRCKHSMAFYVRLAGMADLARRTWEIDVTDLRAWLDVGDRYRDWSDLDRWAIRPAVDEINTKSDIRVSAKARPEPWGRTIRKVEFTVETTVERWTALHRRSSRSRNTPPARRPGL